MSNFTVTGWPSRRCPASEPATSASTSTGAPSGTKVKNCSPDCNTEPGDTRATDSTTLSDSAIAAARASDDRRAEGKPLGRLDGVPVAITDAFDIADMPTSLGLPGHTGLAAVVQAVARKPGGEAA